MLVPGGYFSKAETKSRFPSHPNEQVRSPGTPAAGMTNKKSR